MHEIDAVLIAARRDGFLTIDIPVEELARVVHHCRRSSELARKADFRELVRIMAEKGPLESPRTRFRA